MHTIHTYAAHPYLATKLNMDGLVTFHKIHHAALPYLATKLNMAGLISFHKIHLLLLLNLVTFLSTLQLYLIFTDVCVYKYDMGSL